MGIEYNYPLEQLDKLVVMVYQEGRTPLLPDALKQEVALRYQELQHMDDDEDEDEDYRTAVQQHEDAMRKIEEERRKSHSRNVIILELTEEEKRELHEGMSASYVRSDPNSEYNMSDDDMNADAERKAIYKSLRSIGKIYYHQEDYRNAINIIHRAIEYSLRNDYPWLTFEEACEEFKEGRIKYTFAQLPLLYIDYNTQITDPKVLAGIVSGEIHLIDKDQEPVKKKKVKSKPVDADYTIIGPEEHAEYVKIHNAGYNTPISTILKSCSTIYNRYVIPSSLQFGSSQQKELPTVDWTQPGAGQAYFDALHNIQHNTVSDVVSFLNEQNDKKLNHVIGNGMREFTHAWGPKQETSFKTLSTSLEHHDKAVEIENRILEMMRQTNPQL